MEFKMTPELLDQIVFGMENQDNTFVLDIEKFQILSISEIPDSSENKNNFIELPSWTPMDGFRIMEKFVSSLNNPVFQESLRKVLSGGRGVFRNFKNILKERKEVEQLWYNFKEKEMRQVVIEWYNLLCEKWGCEKIGPEPDETEDLVLSDFVFTDNIDKHNDLVTELDRKAFTENLAAYPSDYVEDLYNKSRKDRDISGENNFILCTETPEEIFAGFLWAVEDPEEIYPVSLIIQLYVVPEFRGLGLGRLLLEKYCNHALKEQIKRISIDLPGTAMDVADRFEVRGFTPVIQKYDLDMEKWSK